MNNYKISVVIPCYYAEKSIASVVEKRRKNFKNTATMNLFW